MAKESKIAAGIVTCNPEIHRLIDNIAALRHIEQISEIIIVDNASTNIVSIDDCISDFDDVRLVKNTKNMGIAKALNQMFEKMAEYEWILTCDQDSIIPKELFDEFEKINHEKLGIFCPAVLDLNTGIVEKAGTEDLSDIDKCITSGSLTSMEAWKSVDGFDEVMFIDSVDFDFCIRLKKSGYKIIQCNKVLIQHEIGKRKIHKFLFWDFCVMNHSAFRKYYMMRNRFYCDYKYFGEIQLISYISFFKTLLFVVFYEKDKWSKVLNMIKGKHDGCKIGKSTYKNRR